MDFKKISLFLGLSIGLSIIGQWLPTVFLEEGNMILPFLRMVLYSWGPAFAVMIIKKLIYRESLSGLGWNRRYFSLRWIGIALAMPILIVAATLGTVFLLGNLMHLPGFGEVILNAAGTSHSLATAYLADPNIVGLSGIWQWMSLPMMPPEIGTLLALILAVGIIGGATFSLIFLVGQELGFRGFLLKETRSMGFLGSNLVIGGIFGLWQMPQLFMLQPSLMADPGLFWYLLATMGFAIAVSFPAAWLAIRTRSVYASATFLGVLTNIAPVSFFFTYNVNPLLGGIEGFAGMMVLLAITFCLIRWDKLMGDDYDKWVF